MKRAIFPKKRQTMSSPSGLSKLPFELLDVIFKELCGKEAQSIRLTSKEWEFASRSFFAARHLSKSVFWLTSSSLRMLEHLACKFGPYMRELFLAADHFTMTGFKRAMGQYLRYRYSKMKGPLYEKRSQNWVHGSTSVLEVKTRSLGLWFKQCEWHTYRSTRQTRRFFIRYIQNIYSQAYLRVLNRDFAKLRRILEQLLDSCEVKVVSLRYDADALDTNSFAYGKPAPEHAFELALYGFGKDWGSDTEYFGYVERVIDKALERRTMVARLP